MYNPGQAVSFTQILDDHSDGNVIDFIHHKLISHVLEFLDREKFKSFTIMSLAAFILTIEEFSLQSQTLMFPTIEKNKK